MVAIKHRMIGAGLAALRMSGLARLAAPRTRGLGAILTFHRVVPAAGDGFAPNQGLEITPEFLDALLGHVVGRGYRFVRLDDVPGLLRDGDGRQPFVALTFDDGYRDTVAAALPVLERHYAPFTVFATTGFLDRTARLWWIELEVALRRLSQVRFGGRDHPTVTPGAKLAAVRAITQALLAEDDDCLLAGVAGIAEQAGVSSAGLVNELCLSWAELTTLARHPLARIGCHTVTHPRLARLPALVARTEISASRDRLERELQGPVTTLCYPYGMASAAGPREFAIARELGFLCAVTTRPGVLTPAHADRTTALPRISVNGHHQDLGAIDVLLSGVGFALWNRLRAPSRAGGPYGRVPVSA